MMFPLLPACVTSARVSHQSTDTLRDFRRVAVTNIEVKLTERSNALVKSVMLVNDTASGVLRFSEDLVRHGTGMPQRDRSVANADAAEARRRRENEERERWVEETVVEFSNRNFLEHGFAPLERRTVKNILKERTFQESGLVDEDSRRNVGMLLGADALFSGRLELDIESGLVGDTVRIHFTGKLVSVDRGEILISGDSRHEADGFSVEAMQDVVDAYFRRVPRLNDGSCLN